MYGYTNHNTVKRNGKLELKKIWLLRVR